MTHLINPIINALHEDDPMPTMPLKPHNVTVQTATVSIQTIRVGKRQVTQAMFRQIPRKPIFDWYDFARYVDQGWYEDRWEDLLVIPDSIGAWGHVQYFWEGDYAGIDYRTNPYTSCSCHVDHRSDDDDYFYGGDGKRHLLYVQHGKPYRAIIFDQPPQCILNSCHSYSPCNPLFSFQDSIVIRDWWQERYAELTALPQLYIAV
jgi:hypothetical protein